MALTKKNNRLFYNQTEIIIDPLTTYDQLHGQFEIRYLHGIKFAYDTISCVYRVIN